MEQYTIENQGSEGFKGLTNSDLNSQCPGRSGKIMVSGSYV